ncbi:MAG: archaeosortase A [Methanothrix sp.]|nr:archaeosortase A [Methanothrix sp.]
MTLDWLVSCTLWIGLLLLLASALMKKSSLAAAGWAIFALFWLSQPGHYLAIEDYFNVALALAVALLCFCMAWRVLRNGFSSSATAWASYAAAVCGILYFPFAKIEPLRDGLIGFTTQTTAETLRFFSVPVAIDGWNIMALNGRSVEIILACTAIESMALFAGVILSVEAPAGRRIAALLTSTSTIFALNIVRNSFVLMAYGYGWFGSDSFNIAHNVIAKAGSTLALLAISYLVFLLLPELLLEIDELAAELRRPGGEAA